MTPNGWLRGRDWEGWVRVGWDTTVASPGQKAANPAPPGTLRERQPCLRTWSNVWALGQEPGDRPSSVESLRDKGLQAAGKEAGAQETVGCSRLEEWAGAWARTARSHGGSASRRVCFPVTCHTGDPPAVRPEAAQFQTLNTGVGRSYHPGISPCTFLFLYRSHYPKINLPVTP